MQMELIQTVEWILLTSTKARELFHQISLVSPPFFLLVHSGRSRYHPWGAALRSAIVPSGCGIPKK
jgi:hypothetical protein